LKVSNQTLPKNKKIDFHFQIKINETIKTPPSLPK